MTKLQPFACLDRYTESQTLCYAQSNGCYDEANYSTLVFGMERKGHKTNKYWPETYAVENTPTGHYSANILQAQPFVAENAAEARTLYPQALDEHINVLQSMRQAIADHEV